MTRKKRLGRGLEALLGTGPATESKEVSGASVATATKAPIKKQETVETTAPARDPDILPFPAASTSSAQSVSEFNDQSEDGDTVKLSVYEIDNNPFQPRREFSQSEIRSLSESLKDHDLLQPILVRRVGSRYQLISGERRLRASIQAGWATIPARIREADDRLVAELAIVENLQRKDLNAIEKALSFKRYIDQHECTQEDLAKRLKIDRSTLTNLIRLLDLPKLVQQSLQQDRITMGHARALLPLANEAIQVDFCNRIQTEGWSVRQAEREVTEKLATDSEPTGVARESAKTRKNAQIKALEQELRLGLGTQVQIKPSTKGKGKIVIQYENAAEFERIHGALTGKQTGGTRRRAA